MIWWSGFLWGSTTIMAMVLMTIGFLLAFRIEEWPDAVTALLIFLAGAGLAWLVLQQ